MEFDLTKYRFIPEIDAIAGLDGRLDLLDLTPVEFEHLVRQLFENVGMQAWVTQASRDDGVDAVATNPDPIVGGLCVIQAKRYRGLVETDAVRALAGVMDDKRAAKGIMVTTSWYGGESWAFAKRQGRIELIDGDRLKYLLSEHRALVLLGAYGGLRIGELAGLRRRRVDLLRGTVDVAEIVVEVRGKLFIGPPKTRAGRRTVGLPRAVVEELAAHLGPVGPADAHVFTAEKGGVLRPSNFRTKVWLPAVQAAGLAPLRPHDLRHTAVALWIAAGANPKEVSVRAGHTSVAFTLDRYGHLFEGHDQELRDRLDAMLAEGRKEASTAVVVQLRAVDPPRRDGPETAQDNPSNDEGPAEYRASPGGLGGAPPGTRTPNRCLKRARTGGLCSLPGPLSCGFGSRTCLAGSRFRVERRNTDGTARRSAAQLRRSVRLPAHRLAGT
jgi:integrase